MPPERLQERLESLVGGGVGLQLAVARSGRPSPESVVIPMGPQYAPISQDTPFNLWCAVKPLVACAALAVLERAGISLGAPMSEYVPAFEDAGDEAPSMAQLLRHESRLPAADTIEMQMLLPDDRRARVEELVRRKNLRPTAVPAYSQFVAWSAILWALEALCGTSGDQAVQAELDAAGHSGVRLHVDDVGHARLEPVLGLYYEPPDGVPGQPLPLVHDHARSVVVDTTCALRGYATALAMTAWYSDLLDTLSLEGCPNRPGFPSHEFLARALASTRTSHAADDTLRRRCDFAAGFMVDLSTHQMSSNFSPSAIGHSGWKGLSVGFADPERGLVGCFVVPLLHDAVQISVLRSAVLDAVFCAA